MPNSKKLAQLAAQFQALCEDENFPFCNDQDDFALWLASIIAAQEQAILLNGKSDKISSNYTTYENNKL